MSERPGPELVEHEHSLPQLCDRLFSVHEGDVELIHVPASQRTVELLHVLGVDKRYYQLVRLQNQDPVKIRTLDEHGWAWPMMDADSGGVMASRMYTCLEHGTVVSDDRTREAVTHLRELLGQEAA